MNDDSASERLAQSYLPVLRGNSLKEAFTAAPQLSGLFLSSLPKDFAYAKYRIMVVGMEPKHWRDRTCPFKGGSDATLSAVLDSMKVHRGVLEQPAGPHKFLQFFKHANMQVQASLSGKKVAFIWANLFCASEAARSPVRSTRLTQIQTMSGSLLRAQIEVANPDAIIFTTGWRYDKYLRSYFPERQNGVARSPKRLWTFQLKETLCLRTSHPRHVAHNGWRTEALQLVVQHLLGKSSASTTILK